MDLEKLRSSTNKTIGTRQTRKALERGHVAEVFVARDAADEVVDPVVKMSDDQGVTVKHVDTMMELGQACGISVGAAVAALLRD